MAENKPEIIEIIDDKKQSFLSLTSLQDVDNEPEIIEDKPKNIEDKPKK